MSLQHVQQPHRDSETLVGSSLPTSAVLAELLPGHSRNSSGTSHSGSGSASGYGSLASQSQHSRQSSSGELGHFRLALFLFFLFSTSSAFLPFRVTKKRALGDSFSYVCSFCLGLFFLFFVWSICRSLLVATVDFRPGQSGLRASPSCVCLSAAALASSLSPFWPRPSCRPTGRLPTLLPRLPASAESALAVTDRKRWRRSVARRTAITRVRCRDRTVVGDPSVRWPLDGRSRSV